MIPKLQELDTIIFDLGEVIVDLDPQAVINEFSRLTSADGSKVANLIVSSPYLHQYETGKLTDREFVTAVNELFQTSVSLEEFTYAWNLMIKNVTKNRLDFLNTLMKTHNVLLLSNTNKMHELYFDEMVKKESGKLMKEFSHTAYYSHLIGYRKPAHDIYEFVIDQQNLVPGRSIFLDDRPENVAAAREVGLHAVQVAYPDQIFEILKNE